MTDSLVAPPADELDEPEAPEAEPRPSAAERRARRRRLVAEGTRVVTFAVFAMAFLAAVVGNWLRSQNVDPMYDYDVVLRTLRFGGSYYQNGILNKGPLQSVIYESATWFTSHNGFWYGISLYIAIVALVVGIAAARTARTLGANRDLAIAAAAVVFVHLTFSKSDYAGVLYVRNVTTAMLCACWIIALSKAPWATKRRAFWTAIVVGATLGVAVQTLTTTAFAAAAVTIVTLGIARLERPSSERFSLDRAFVIAGVIGFLSAPVWYALRGSFTEFFSGWWTYARDMNVGTGRSLGAQLALGWHSFYLYYQERPIAFLAIVAFLGIAGLDWKTASTRERLVYGGLIGWWLSAWIELVLSQRYSSHYFSVSTVPTALMIAAVAGRVYRAAVARRGAISWSYAWPLLAFVLAIYLGGADQFVTSVQDLSKFTSVQAHAAEVAKGESGSDRTVRSVLDLVSKDNDALLMWTNDPWPYLNYHRVSATRFIWESFLQGQIYLGRTSPDYILPHSWQWFASDLKQSNPTGYVKSGGGDIPVDSPFQKYLNDKMTLVYPDDSTPVSLRTDLAPAILNPTTPNDFSPPGTPKPGSGWKVSGNNVTYDATATDRSTDTLWFSAGPCFSLTGTVQSDGAPGGMVFRMIDSTGKAETTKLDFDGDHVSSSTDAVEFARAPSNASGNGPTKFSLIVGKRSAALVTGGRVGAATQIAPNMHIDIESQRGHLELRDLKVGPPPPGSGCPGS